MTNNDKQDFAAIMTGLAENYGQTLTPQGINMRFQALKKFSIEDVGAAAMSLMSARKYTTMPTVADFLEHLGGGSAEDQAEVEAGKVLNAIKRVGAYSSVVFDDPITQAVVAKTFGGWVMLCQECGVEETEKWFRHGFVKSWAAYKRQGIRQYGHLPGIIETQNASSGYLGLVPDPVMIGDRTKALAVLNHQEYPQSLPRVGNVIPIANRVSG
ncbi:DUF6475 domain-containing protein [Desulfosarcina sp. OttesenSCG-928-A07]|nr:DUF6475 domain-containing protein [Desulfosarcina sp. OttesenSCG-928-G17]MDL2329068.1 DUF6475 domain-containing protein [Desulfosarcina sp. OttesenSCG-928-A07]